MLRRPRLVPCWCHRPAAVPLGNWGLPEAQRWEDYWLDESFVIPRDAQPFIATPLGTEPAAAPLTTVAPELLIGNPYAELLPNRRDPVGLVASALRQVEEVLAAAQTERELVASR